MAECVVIGQDVTGQEGPRKVSAIELMGGSRVASIRRGLMGQGATKEGLYQIIGLLLLAQTEVRRR